MVAVVYWSARLAVNEEVRVRSPPITPASNNWVWVNGWPPGPEPGPRRFDSCRPDGSRTQARPRRWPRGRPAPGPRTGVQGCLASNPRRVRFPRGPHDGPVDYSEMSAPSQGAGPGSTPGRVTTSHWSTRRRMPDFQSGERGSTPRWDTESRVLPNGRQPVPKTGVVVMSPRGSIPPLSSEPNLRGRGCSLYPWEAA